MRILVTGAKGFIGRNLVSELRHQKYLDIYEYDINSTVDDLEMYTRDCNFVFHLAGVNRPLDPKEFIEGNYGFTSELLDRLKRHNNKSPVMLASSIQALSSNPYGLSKKAGEDLLLNYSKETGARVCIYRFPNVFGKWCRPNYNSVIATFCHNIANGLEIKVNDPNVDLNLIYIDDLVQEIIKGLSGNENRIDGICYVEPVFSVKLAKIVELLYSFRDSRINHFIPDVSTPFTNKLYATYLSYLPTSDFGYNLNMNADFRGSFTEFVKTIDKGQVSINISKPGIVKGNHWHHTKNEKFLVVSGQGVIRLRKIDESEVVEFVVSGSMMRVIDIPPGYTHNIENTGQSDMVTVIWASETYDPDRPDTIYLEV
jgi:UDP-2-acetamido-2,6-beta-L-arabino-hexul-4-ose reductase